MTFGAGLVSKGKGVISNQSSELTSDTVNGRSWFGVFSLEYELPVNLGFIGLEFTEILFGYRCVPKMKFQGRNNLHIVVVR